MIAIDFQMTAIETDWQDQFTAFLESSGCSSATIKAYRQDLTHFSRWFETTNGQALKLELITGVDLRYYRQSALESGASPSTINRRRATLKRLSAWAFNTGVLNYNPFQGVERVDQAELPPRWLSDLEYHRLVRQVEQAVNGARSDHWRWQAVRDQAIVALMIHAGLREAELCALDWRDVTIGERKGKVVVKRGKGEKRREIPLNGEARRALRLWEQVSERSEGPLFCGKGRETISPKLVQNRVAALRQAAGLDAHVTPHALRHTFAKRLLDGGAPLTVVQKLLGHSRLDTTARYVQPGWNDFEKAVEKL